MSTQLQAHLTIYPAEKIGRPIPARLFGNFLEHLGYAIDGGLLAHALANPTFERDPHLSEAQVHALLEAGQILTHFYEQGCDPAVIPDNWSPGIGATGFGVCALDDARQHNAPFPWAPLGGSDVVSPSVGMVGGAVRLHGRAWGGELHAADLIPLQEGPAGIRQGIFLPFQRCPSYHGSLVLRIATSGKPIPESRGSIEIGLRRRMARPGQDQRVGECLALDVLVVRGSDWQNIDYHFELPRGSASLSEPVDFFIRWRPEAIDGVLPDLLIDRAILLPTDAVDGIFDPDVLQAVKDWRVPLLRWPGGNFVSYYHWRDGIGPFARRPTRPNYAWGGLETNFFGTAEFLRFCRLVGAEPQITVNTGTGTAEEAADWVSFCNAPAVTPMGKKRASGGDAEPYNVRLWEVGNEIYGSWQGGYHGGDENAARFCEFAPAMRAVDPTIELIATGNSFDVAPPNPRLDHTTADQVWNEKVIAACAEQMDYLSLHSLPANDVYLDAMTPSEAYYSLMSQPDAWEQVFLPHLQQLAAQSPRQDAARPPVRLAITEWGVLGPRSDVHPVVENFGEVIYLGLFLNMCIRNHAFVPVANATGLLHGGCIRKAAGQVYYDPQYTALREYTRLAGTVPLRTALTVAGYSVQTAADLGLPLENVPFVDAIACRDEESGQITVCVVNRHLEKSIPLHIMMENAVAGSPSFAYMSHPDVTSRARLGVAGQFGLQSGTVEKIENGYLAVLPACSVGWISF